MGGIPYPRTNQPRTGRGGYRPAPRPMPTPAARMPVQLPPPAVPAGAMAGMRLAGRLVPWLGLALLLYELWQLMQWKRANGANSGFDENSCCGDQSPQNPADAWMAFYEQGPQPSNCGNFCFANDLPVTMLQPHPSTNGYRVAWARPRNQNFMIVSRGKTYNRSVGAVERPNPFVWNLPLDVPLPRNDPRPWVAPLIDPFSKPIEQPEPDAGPLPYHLLPYRVANPFRSPHEQPQRGYEVPTPYRVPAPVGEKRVATRGEIWLEPVGDPGVAPARQPLPVPAVHPAALPYPFLAPSMPGVPGIGITIEPSGRLAIVPPPALPPLPRPPGRGVVEKKVKAIGAGVTWRIANHVTESRDFVRELWKGLDPKWRNQQNPDLWRIKGWKPLPRGPRTAIPTMQDMMDQIYRGVREGKMDWNKALDNLVENHYSDKFWGRLGRELGKASKRSRRPVGYGAGPLM